MVGVTVVYGLSMGLISGATLLWMVLPLLIIGAMSQTIFRAANTTILLDQTPDALRGRVLSVTFVGRSISPVVAIAAGAVADYWGAGAGFLFLGSGILAVAVIATLLNPGIRKA